MSGDVVLIPLQTVPVRRGDNRVTPAIGKPFQFTAAEAESLLHRAPDSVRRIDDPPDVDEQMTAAKVEPIQRPAVRPQTPIRPNGTPIRRGGRGPRAEADDGEV